VGFVYAPVRAFVEPELWEQLPLEFLDSAIRSDHETEKLLEVADVNYSIVTNTVTNYKDDINVRHHPVFPRTSAAKKIKNVLQPLQFNVLIDCYDEQLQDIFEMNVGQ
jgi:hypothetical protein